MKQQSVTERIEFMLACMPLRKRVIILQALLESADRRVAEQRNDREEHWRDEARGALNL